MLTFPCLYIYQVVKEGMLMKQDSSTLKVMRCGLGMTDNARKGIAKFTTDEYAFFSMQESFFVHIEKRSNNKQGNMSFSIYFDNVTNDVLSKRLNDRVAVMECVYQNESFLATGFQVRGRKEPVQTNRRLPIQLKFLVGRSTGIGMPIELYTSIRELPIAQERSEYVKKRIAGWEGYLRVEERNADVEDVTTSFSHASLNEDLSKLTIRCRDLKGNEWNAINGFSVKLKGHQSEIGNVINTSKGKGIIEIELNRTFKEMVRRNEWNPNTSKDLVFSNFAALSQVKRLRKGFKDLQDGLAANANLERVLFEERPVVRISKKQQNLVFHNELNQFQKEAVTGAMTSNDLYVIQGPPGTGKTTVISEICHQNVKSGLRTLVASQANLAVDNALGRLLSHQDVRILRYGRTESIEEEGKKFIEENVALNWKNVTLDAINAKLESNTNREIQINDLLISNRIKLTEMQNELVSLEERVKLKEAAQEQYITHSLAMKKLLNDIKNFKEESDKLEGIQSALIQSEVTLTRDVNQLEELVLSKSTSTVTGGQMEKLEIRLKKLQYYISHSQTVNRIDEINSSIVAFHKEMQRIDIKMNSLHVFSEEIKKVTKIDILKKQMDTFEIVPNSETSRRISELNQLIATIKSETAAVGYKEWQELTYRLYNAIEMIELLLKDNGFINKEMKRTVNQKYSSVIEINGLIDRVGKFLIDPSTMSSLETRSYSAQKYDNLEKIAIALEMLRERKRFSEMQEVSFEKQNQFKVNAKNMFDVINIEIIEQVNQTIVELGQEKRAIELIVNNHRTELISLQQKNMKHLEKMGPFDETITISFAKDELKKNEEILLDYKDKIKDFQQYELELEKKKCNLKITTDNYLDTSKALNDIKDKTEALSSNLMKVEKVMASLDKLLDENPEGIRRQVLTSIQAISTEVEKLKVEKERLPISDKLQKEWVSLLTTATEYDLDEIRKLYVKHANVIGTTCVASARRDFMEEYPTFDVVIIDEVSKATPPELLLPMLKGKKIILVGDHHQLPPLMGQETLEELLEESNSHEEKNELENLLKESLFERLFRTLPKQNKTMLGIQYRMHESIMETITPFYKEGNYSLQCGLTDSDVLRDHLLDSHFVKRSDHLLWFDMPNEQKYFEEKVKGGTSRFNQAELNMTCKILKDLDAATENAKAAGIMKQDTQKSVGVISFYGEQVKRIDRLIQQELIPKHLNCRTGSVDKFQGMEMDVIILSFVRNHREKGGDIGFARDYRRLNVALSRARELLIIVGSSEMFTVQTKHPSSREMYGRLLENIKMKNGFRDLHGIAKS